MSLNINDCAKNILDELGRTLPAISQEEAERFASLVLGAGSVFVAGAGRSGFAVKAFCMRLMHMRFTAHVVGETTTPNIRPGDLLVIGSGSGETASLAGHAKKAKEIGASLALVTILPQSTIGRLADVSVQISAPTPKAESAGFRSIQPMGSLFEQSLSLFLDAVILMLMDKKQDNSSEMFTQHANLE